MRFSCRPSSAFLLLRLVAAVSSSEAWVLPTSTATTTGRGTAALSLSLLQGSSSCRATTTAMSAAAAASDSNSVAWCEIIGAGRIGSLLAEQGNCVVLGRNDAIDPNQTGRPIFIATRNDALASIVEKCPKQRQADLVFLQNGYLDNVLEEYNLKDNTQALLYLSVTAKGVPAVDGITAVNPEGLTAATGRHAQALADRLAAANLKCNVVTAAAYRPAMFEKLIWIATYMLVGTAKECASVGQAGQEHGDLVRQVIEELMAAVTAAEEGVEFAPGTVERLAAYTDVVADFPCGVKEFEWRNQYFYNLLADGGGDKKEACPVHNGLLRECQKKGFLGFALE